MRGWRGIGVRLSSIRVGDIHCRACASSIEEAISRLDGVYEVWVVVRDKRVVVRYDPDRLSRDDLLRAIRDLGFNPEE